MKSHRKHYIAVSVMLLLFVLLPLSLWSLLYFLIHSVPRSSCQYFLSRLDSWFYPITSAIMCFKIYSGDLEEKNVRGSIDRD